MTALAGTAIAIALFATETISAGILPIVRTIAIVSLPIFPAYKIAYHLTIPNSKINELILLEKQHKPVNSSKVGIIL